MAGRRGSLRGAPFAVCGGGWLVACVALAAAGCSEDPLTELVVAVDSDLAVPEELQSVRLRIEGPSGDEALDQTADLTAAGAPRLPLTLSLTPGSDALGPVVITATGSRAGGGSVERRVETGFVAGERRLVTMPLVRACVGAICPVGETCAEGGVCVGVVIEPDSLAPWTGDPGELDAGAVLDAGVDAATDASVVTDAGADADAGPECTSDGDCPEDLMHPCVESCAGCDEPVEDCRGTCERTVTRHSCVDGTCVPSDEVETADCFCPLGTSCDPNDACVEEATCSANGACLGSLMPCPPGCRCDPAYGVCMDESDEAMLCALH